MASLHSLLEWAMPGAAGVMAVLLQLGRRNVTMNIIPPMARPGSWIITKSVLASEGDTFYRPFFTTLSLSNLENEYFYLIQFWNLSNAAIDGPI